MTELNKLEVFAHFKSQYGEWPPKPLDCEALPEMNFTVRRPGLYLHAHKILCEVKSRFSLLKTISMAGHFEFLADLRKGLLKEVAKQTYQVDRNSLGKRILRAGIGFLDLIFKPLMFLKILLRLRPFVNGGEDAVAFVLPHSTHNVYLIEPESQNLHSIIGHECIHLLQNCRSDIGLSKANNSYWLKKKFASGSFYNSGVNSERHMAYLFQQIEVEARLHEVFVYFYRELGYLPTSQIAFVSALFSFSFCTSFDELYSEQDVFKDKRKFLSETKAYSDANGIPWLKYDTYESLDVEMKILVNNYKDQLFLINDYLFRCYKNLLRLYGDRTN